MRRAVLMVMLCTACSAELGERCRRDADCDPGLRCSSRNAEERGVCTFAEGLPDVGVSTDGSAAADLRLDVLRDAATDGAIDAVVEDAASDTAAGPSPDAIHSDGSGSSDAPTDALRMDSVFDGAANDVGAG